MSPRNQVSFENGVLAVRSPGFDRLVDPAEISRIFACHMADAIHHGEEQFHVVLTNRDFILLGPFVPGALGAVEALHRASPGIAVEDRTVGRIPFRYRDRGWLGLRLFPVAGLKTGKLRDLSEFQMASTGDDNV